MRPGVPASRRPGVPASRRPGVPASCSLVVAVVALACAACEQSDSNSAERYERTKSSEPRPLSEHSALRSEPTRESSLALGDDCSTLGPKACRSGLCVQGEAGITTGRVCATWCSETQKCPDGWSCVTYGLTSGAVCLPSPVQFARRAAQFDGGTP
jgi:hypothetical protein